MTKNYEKIMNNRVLHSYYIRAKEEFTSTDNICERNIELLLQVPQCDAYLYNLDLIVFSESSYELHFSIYCIRAECRYRTFFYIAIRIQRKQSPSSINIARDKSCHYKINTVTNWDPEKMLNIT